MLQCRMKGVPADEAERLVSLHRLGLLGLRRRPPRSMASTRLAAAALRVPMLLVSLVDQNRVWFKSRVGLTLRESRAHGLVLQPSHASSASRSIGARCRRGSALRRQRAGVGRRPRSAPISAFRCSPATASRSAPCAPWTPQAREFGEVERVVLRSSRKSPRSCSAAQEVGGPRPTASCSTRWSARSCSARPSSRPRSASCTPRCTARSCAPISAPAALLGYSAAELRELSFRDLTHPEDFAANVRRVQARAGRRNRQLPPGAAAALQGPALPVGRRLGDPQAHRRRDSPTTASSSSTICPRRNSRSRCAAAMPLRTGSRADQAQEADELDRTPGCRCRALRRARTQRPDARARLARRAGDASPAVDSQESQRALQHAGDAAPSGAASTLHSTRQALLDAQALQREAQAALQAANAKLAAESATDALTGLPNRRSFSRRSEQAAQALRHSNKPYGLILLDLDNFKQINEEYGHDVGDEVLRALGNILTRSCAIPRTWRRVWAAMSSRCCASATSTSRRCTMWRSAFMRRSARSRSRRRKGLLRFTGSFGLALEHAGRSRLENAVRPRGCGVARGQGRGQGPDLLRPLAFEERHRAPAGALPPCPRPALRV